MATRRRFERNSRGFEELLKADFIRDDLTRRAEAMAAQARVTAPVATGAYRDSITVVQDTTDRAVVRVIATDRKAPLIEAKTGNLSRARDAAGGS